MRLISACVSSILRTGHVCVSQTRWKSRVATNSKRFSRTLNLPKTSFPLTMKDGVAPKREIQVQHDADFDGLYQWQSSVDQKETFVLHDGPPYANGDPHVGHALNKILKDITNRYKLLRGYKVHYIPGWDCHGLPIEQKALTNIKEDHRKLDPMRIRNVAKQFAKKAIKKQMKDFRRWGIMADWSNCYYTFDKAYEAEQLEAFYSMYEKDLIYRDFMPVHWSPSSRTALAEAELEYNDQHVSTAVYVQFPLVDVSKFTDKCGQAYAVIWTTTPWTLPANQAICYGHGIKYSLARNEISKDVYLICNSVIDKMSEILQVKLTTICELEGSQLEGLQYIHPMHGKEQPLLSANHVTVEKGTGLVHVAPAHGVEDFQVATHNNLKVNCMVDEEGKYTDLAGADLAGLSVQSEGSVKVLNKLGENILHQEAFTHSYPYDWRTKLPVIIRASEQWFVRTSNIKEKALEALQKVSISPKSSGHGMMSQLDMRTYWCISRQRAWGVPIPVFYEKTSGKHLLTRPFIDHLVGLVREHGTDCWWTLPTEQLLPPQVIEDSGFSKDSDFIKGSDVLDIWFDSGTSWASVLKNTGRTADVYLEGLDQFGGWFQSSLLTSIAAQDKAPYKALVVHGFTLDEEGKKMSKSVGNVVDPNSVINGSSDKSSPAYGADVLRWWAAWSGLDSKVFIGPSILQQCNEQLFRMRKTLRYLVGNLADFEPSEETVSDDDLFPQDQYMLHLLHQLGSKIESYYDNFQYSRVLGTLEKFTNTHISNYLHIIKDRAYCDHSEDVSRRATQTIQYYLLESLTKYLAPIIPHLAEEVFQHTPYLQFEESLFKTPWFTTQQSWHKPDLALTFDLVHSIRSQFNVLVDSENPVAFDLVICCHGSTFDRIKTLQNTLTSQTSPLAEILQCSTVSVLSRPPLVIPDEATPVDGRCVLTYPGGREETHNYLIVVLPAENFPCERCRRHTAPQYNALCARCEDVLGTGWE